MACNNFDKTQFKTLGPFGRALYEILYLAEFSKADKIKNGHDKLNQIPNHQLNS